MQEKEYSQEALDLFNKQAEEKYAALIEQYPVIVSLPLKYYYPKAEEIVSKVRRELWTQGPVTWDIWTKVDEDVILFLFQDKQYARKFKVEVKWPMIKQGISDWPRNVSIKFLNGIRSMWYGVLKRLLF